MPAVPIERPAAPDTHPDMWRPAWLIAAVAFAAAIGLFTRIWGLSRPLWFDELFSVVMSAPDLLAIPAFHAQYDIHPPLYSLILHAWRRFGDSAGWLRGLSVVLAYVTVAAFVVLAKRWRGTRFAIVVAMLTLAAPILTVVAQQVRHYVLLSMFSALALLPLPAILQGRGRWGHYGWLGLACTACLYTHYMGGYYGALLIAGACLAAPSMAVRVRLIATSLVVVVAFLPWASRFAEQLARERSLHGGSFEWSAVEAIVNGVTLWLGSAGASARPAGLGYSVLLLSVVAWRVFTWLRSREWPDAFERLTFGLWLLGPLVYLLLVVTFGLRMTSVSYLVSFGQLSALFVAAALTESALRPALRAGATVGVLAVLAAASWDKGVTAQRTEDWPAAARCLREHVKAGDALVFANGVSKQMLAFYDRTALRGFANPGEFVYARHPQQGIAGDEIVRYVGDRARVWVLSAYTENGPIVAAALTARGWTPTAGLTCGPVVFQPLGRTTAPPAPSRPGS